MELLVNNQNYDEPRIVVQTYRTTLYPEIIGVNLII
jgi:hypothetical protein